MRLTVLTVPCSDVEVAADRLWCAGATAVESRVEAGGVVALVTVLADDDDRSLERIGPLGPDWVLTFVDDVAQANEGWRDHARPVVVNAELIINPAWWPITAPPSSRTIVSIEPGGAFGLGDHPTTRMTADAAWRLTKPGDRVIDVGSGSGVLAIVALLKGAASAVAIDIAEAARESTVANAALNGVGDRVDASCRQVAEIDDEFDLAFANILAPTLIAMADDLVRLIRPGGRLVVSGVLAERHDHVVDALAELELCETKVDDAWACLEFVRPAE
jgi:ribosomal protein L11 methyltransferase